MIVARLGDLYRFVTQGDHAHLSAELLALFRLPELVEHPRRERLLRAVREHDNGWREADAAPRIDPASGEPRGFRDIDGELRREIWLRSCGRFRDEDPYVALLITQHAIALHGDRAGSEAWDAWLADLRALRQELLEEAGIDDAEASSDHELLRLADACSLALCEQSGAAFHARGIDGAAAGRTLRLAPFPMAGRTTFRLPCRRVSSRSYDSDRDLGSALASARWEDDPVQLAPAEYPPFADRSSKAGQISC